MPHCFLKILYVICKELIGRGVDNFLKLSEDLWYVSKEKQRIVLYQNFWNKR